MRTIYQSKGGNGMEYKVVANDKTKSTMFYVRRDKNE